MEKNNCLEALKSFIDRIDDESGWQYYLPILGNKDEDANQDMIPNSNILFRMHKETMTIFWAEASWSKNHG